MTSPHSPPNAPRPALRDRGASALLAGGLGPAALPDGASAGAFWGGVAIAACAVAGAWWTMRRRQRRAEQRVLDEARRLAMVLERADCLLWEADVRLVGDDWKWAVRVREDGLYRRLFANDPAAEARGLWNRIAHCIPEIEEMHRRCRAALEQGASGYEQSFRIRQAERVTWLHEKVTITLRGPNRFLLVGLASDVTAQRAAAEAARSNQAQMANLLSRTDCLLWQATVRRQPDGSMVWTWFIPKSELYRRLVGPEAGERPERMWESWHTPDLEEMDRRSRTALEQGLPGYEQEFRILLRSRLTWLREKVSIVPVGPDEWNLVGFAIDVTEQRWAEETKRASEAQLQHVLTSADFMLWHAQVFLAEDGVFRWVMSVPRSTLHRRLFGADPAADPALVWDNLVEDRARREIDERAQQALRSGASGYEQEFAAARDGQEFWLREQVSIRTVGAGRWQLVGVITDETARHRAEVARGASERNLRDILLRADCLLWRSRVVPDGDAVRFEYFDMPRSALYEELFGEAEASVRMWDLLRVPDIREMGRRAARAVYSGDSGYEQEFSAWRGERFFRLHEQVSIERTGAGVWQLVGLLTDVTARYLAEEARRASEQQLGQILELADCMVWIGELTPRGDGAHDWRIYAPRSVLYLRIFGDPGPVERPTFNWHELNVPEISEMDRRTEQAINSGAPGYEQEFHVVRPDGEIWLHEAVTISREMSGLRLVGVLTDITARHRAEQLARRTEAQLQELLVHADCMIWQARVQRSPDGELGWRVFFPRSSLFRKIWPKDSPDALSLNWRALGVPESDAMHARSRAAMLRHDRAYDQEFHVPRAGGDIWLREQVTIEADGTDCWNLVGVITDITERKRADLERQASEEKLTKLMEVAECMLWEGTVRIGAGGEVKWEIFTPRSILFRRLFGEQAGLEAFRWEKLNVVEVEEMRRRGDEAVRNGEGGYVQEFHFERDGRTTWLHESVTIHVRSATERRLSGIVTDITARRAAEAARRAYEERLNKIFAVADCLLWHAQVQQAADGGLEWLVFVPPSVLFQRLFHRQPDDPRNNLNWDEANVPEYPEMARRSAAAILGGLPGYEQEFRARVDGRTYWLSEQASITRTGPAQWELVGVVLDISARREAEQAVRSSERRYHSLFEHTPVAVVETDFTEVGRWLEEVRTASDGDVSGWLAARPREVMRGAGLVRMVDCNEAALSIFRAGSKDDLRERRRWLETRDSLRAIREVFTAMAAGRNTLELEMRMRGFDGSSRHVHVRWWIGVGENGLDLTQSVMVFVDLTDLKRAETALAAEKERLAVTLRAMAEGVVTIDRGGRVLYLNPAAAAMLGRTPEETAGRHVGEVCRFTREPGGESWPVPFARVAADGAVVDLPAQTQLAAPDGSRRMVEGCCAPVHDADDTVVGTVLVFRDMTERDRLERELVRASKLESVGILAGGIAHDFNNILTVVMGNLTLAQLDIDPQSEAGQSLTGAERAALRARDLTQQLLTFAKGGEPVRAAVQLPAIVREMVDFALHGSRVRAVYELAPDLWPADADKGQIGRVVQNLVINAVQAMPNGGTVTIAGTNETIQAPSRHALAAGDYVRLSITDTGVGIPPENLARIFDPYFTTKQTGSGLGLAAVYSIVRKHKGLIDVESQVGRGTAFHIWLPALREAAAVAAPAPAKAATRLGGRVLFMDDEESIRTMAVALLRRFGLEVDCAVDGGEAVEMYSRARDAGRPFSLVVMDLTVPGGMGGREAMERIRAIDPGVRAIVSSGYSSDPVMADYRAYGFCGMVAKPYEVAEFARVLREALGEPRKD